MARRSQSAGHAIMGIVTYPRAEHDADSLEHLAERSEGLYESVFEFARERQIELLETADINSPSALEWLAGRDIELIVSFRFRQILRKQILNMFEHRLVNIHIGDLPRYRGSGAMSWMILNNENQTAITYHHMAIGVDSGRIVHRAAFAIPDQARPIDIYRVASERILASFLDVIDKFADGKATGAEQPLESGSYFPRLNTLRDGKVRFDFSPEQFERFCRAFGNPYLGAHGMLAGKKIHFGRVRPLAATGTFHPFSNGCVYSESHERQSVSVITGTGSVEVHSLRVANQEASPMGVLRLGSRLD
jgi:methionyl-tRNA formyltransferase